MGDYFFIYNVRKNILYQGGKIMAPKRLTIDDYEITRDGQVINKTNGHVLKPQPNGKGYLRDRIGGQLTLVHR